MNKNIDKNKLIELLDNPQNLPEKAFTVLPSNPKLVIIVVKGETGYYPYQEYETEEYAAGTVEYANASMEVCPEAVEALKILSMRGACV